GVTLAPPVSPAFTVFIATGVIRSGRSAMSSASLVYGPSKPAQLIKNPKTSLKYEQTYTSYSVEANMKLKLTESPAGMKSNSTTVTSQRLPVTICDKSGSDPDPEPPDPISQVAIPTCFVVMTNPSSKGKPDPVALKLPTVGRL